MSLFCEATLSFQKTQRGASKSSPIGEKSSPIGEKLSQSVHPVSKLVGKWLAGKILQVGGLNGRARWGAVEPKAGWSLF